MFKASTPSAVANGSDAQAQPRGASVRRGQRVCFFRAQLAGLRFRGVCLVPGGYERWALTPAAIGPFIGYVSCCGRCRS